VSAFIDMHRERFGVEPICRVLDVSASAYYQRAKGEPSARAIEDQRLLSVIRETHKQTTRPTGIGARGRRCDAPARARRAARCSG
jgi:putative transposase